MLGNKLKLNSNKTYSIIFGLPHLVSLIKQLQPAMQLEGCATQPKLSTESLGVHFDSEVSMLPQVNHATHSALWQMRKIGPIRCYQSEASLVWIVQAFDNILVDYDKSPLVGLTQYTLHTFEVGQNGEGHLVSKISRLTLVASCSKNCIGSQYTAVPYSSSLPWSPTHSEQNILRT